MICEVNILLYTRVRLAVAIKDRENSRFANIGTESKHVTLRRLQKSMGQVLLICVIHFAYLRTIPTYIQPNLCCKVTGRKCY